ncbi:MAG TPA: hypothetical protein VJZ00_11050 [Thermoanaerobaculia bacterium]|nr:hypothetical protein [Thermoanaerobaculia bacterium]
MVTMTMQTTIWFGLAMATIAVINATLMAWLWRFPMAPDPSGRSPHGISTAPRAGVLLHRGLGYVFILLYAALLFEMLPRTWEFRVATPTSIVHGILGVFIGLLLTVKIAVIRRFHSFGHRLPWIGGTLAVTTIITAALGVVPAWRVVQPLAKLTPEQTRGREALSSKCNQCHGASTIASEREDAREWSRITRKMQRFSRTIPGKDPISDEERIAAARYLSSILAEAGEEEDSDEEGDDEERHDEDDRADRDRRERRGRGR